MNWVERDHGLGTLPPACDLWADGRILGCVIPAREDGRVSWHAHRALSGLEAGCWDKRGNSHLGTRENRDDAMRLVETNKLKG